MPRTRRVVFQQADGSVPLLVWLDGLAGKARSKCLVRLERLGELGHELRRPEADYLRDGIHELRMKAHGVNYRMLYFFNDREIVVTHGFTKQRAEVPAQEIALALRRKRSFGESPDRHRFEGGR